MGCGRTRAASRPGSGTRDLLCGRTALRARGGRGRRWTARRPRAAAPSSRRPRSARARAAAISSPISGTSRSVGLRRAKPTPTSEPVSRVCSRATARVALVLADLDGHGPGRCRRPRNLLARSGPVSTGSAGRAGAARRRPRGRRTSGPARRPRARRRMRRDLTPCAAGRRLARRCCTGSGRPTVPELARPARAACPSGTATSASARCTPPSCAAYLDRTLAGAGGAVSLGARVRGRLVGAVTSWCRSAATSARWPPSSTRPGTTTAWAPSLLEELAAVAVRARDRAGWSPTCSPRTARWSAC